MAEYSGQPCSAGFKETRLSSRLLIIFPACLKRFGHLLSGRSEPRGLSSLKIVQHFPDLTSRSEMDIGSLTASREEGPPHQALLANRQSRSDWNPGSRRISQPLIIF